eukprot:355647-Chlamydomonas_euryale.AAC.2
MLPGLRPRATAAGARLWLRPVGRPSAPSARSRPVPTRAQKPERDAIDGAGAAVDAGGEGDGDGPNYWEGSFVVRRGLSELFVLARLPAVCVPGSLGRFELRLHVLSWG